MELFVIYLWLKMDLFIRVFLIVSIGLSCLISFIYAVAPDKISALYKKSYKRFLIVMSIMFSVGIILPDSQSIAILVGASYAVDFAKSPEGAKIGTLIRKKANDYLDEQLKEVAKEQQPAASKP